MQDLLLTDIGEKILKISFIIKYCIRTSCIDF
jgi:hypothetical protein